MRNAQRWFSRHGFDTLQSNEPRNGYSMSAASKLSLTPQQQDLIDRLVSTGRFDGANDVVSAGLRLVEEREKLAADFIAGLEADIDKGLASGASAPMESAAELLASFRGQR
jgi:antitoxin ParD1/3/4